MWNEIKCDLRETKKGGKCLFCCTWTVRASNPTFLLRITVSWEQRSGVKVCLQDTRVTSTGRGVKYVFEEAKHEY